MGQKNEDGDPRFFYTCETLPSTTKKKKLRPKSEFEKM